MVGPTDANAGYDELLDAVEAGAGYYYECERGHGALPPRRVCPRCGSADLDESPLPAVGEVETHTTVHVATPQLVDDVPYLTAIARFGPVRVTGFLRGVDPDAAAVGMTVAISVEPTETTGERALALRPP